MSDCIILLLFKLLKQVKCRQLIKADVFHVYFSSNTLMMCCSGLPVPVTLHTLSSLKCSVL